MGETKKWRKKYNVLRIAVWQSHSTSPHASEHAAATNGRREWTKKCGNKNHPAFIFNCYLLWGEREIFIFNFHLNICITFASALMQMDWHSHWIHFESEEAGKKWYGRQPACRNRKNLPVHLHKSVFILHIDSWKWFLPGDRPSLRTNWTFPWMRNRTKDASRRLLHLISSWMKCFHSAPNS